MADLQELAERLLSRQYLYPGRPATARLLPNELPTDLPFAVPLPERARVIGSGIGSLDGSEAIFDFYRRETEARGWTARRGNCRRALTCGSLAPPR